MPNSSTLRAAPAAGSASALRAVTPDDGADLPDGAARGLFVGEAGDVRITDGTGVVNRIVSGAAQYHPVQVARVHASGTTAGAILALY